MRNGISPYRVLLFLFAVFFFLGLISLFFPPGGILFGERFHLQFPGIRDILRPDPPEYADITHLLEAYADVAADDYEPLPVPPPELLPAWQENRDTLTEQESKPGAGANETVKDGVETGFADEGVLRKLVVPVEFPPGNDTVLDPFYRGLREVGEGNMPLRIMHYGDSQIENNRITSTFRNRFQVRFGGSGIGMFPVLSPVPHNASVRVITSGNWSRHTPLEGGRGDPVHNRYGLLLSYSSLGTAAGGGIDGSFTLRPVDLGYRRLRRMKELTLFFGFNREPFTIELVHSEGIIDAELIFPGNSPAALKWSLPHENAEYTVRLRGDGSPRIFAVSLDDVSGVAVDNVPLRGSSGLEFSRSNPDVMRQMLELLNVRLMLLQFGVNVVPNIVDDYTYYENGLLRELNFLRSLDPGICIIVIGVSDMSRRASGGYYESYPNIEKIRDAQRNAAFRAGFAFWDFYGAMGGKNSMPAWVAADPPLAQSDYTHFTFRGSALAGDLLYNSLIAGYESYIERLEREKNL